MFDKLASTRRLSLLTHTGMNLQPRQVVGMADRALRHTFVPRLPVDFDARYEQLIPSDPPTETQDIKQNLGALRQSVSDDRRASYRRHLSELVDGQITFFDSTLDIGDPATFDWSHETIESFTPLWRLYLHAFEPVRWLIFSDAASECPDNHLAAVRALVCGWDEHVDVGGEQYLRRAWTPHAVSLRILALCRLATWLPDSSTTFARRVRRLAYKNARFLENHVEYDVGGNHLVENGTALLVAGTLFDDGNRGWRETGKSILEECADQQFLVDGGHFERSPMYHVLVLQRYLTAFDLLSSTDESVPANIRRIAKRGTGFLESLAPPDQRIPLLNDAAFDEFLSLESCLRFADAVGIDGTNADETLLVDSGYYWLGDGGDRLLIDGGPVGPSHLPGHSHNDMLSVMLWVDGQRILTDTGAFDYVPDETRQYARSVQAHNTVQVGDYEPIPIGGQFLMGRRCQPRGNVRRGCEHDRFTGWYERRRRLESLYRHQRDVIAGDRWWVIADTVEGSPGSNTEAMFHFHPSIDIERSNSEVHFERAGSATGCGIIRPIGASNSEMTTTPYFPRFGERIERSALQVRYNRNAILNGALVVAGDERKLTVTVEEPNTICVTVDGRQRKFSLPVVPME